LTQRKILFEDLRSGGIALAAALTGYANRDDVVVLGIVRGGVPLAIEVASALGAPLDLVVRRGLFQKSFEDCVGVVSVAGTEVIDPGILEVEEPKTGEEFFVQEALSQFRARILECRGAREPLSVEGRTVVLVDNGIRTSLTMGTSIQAVRRLNPARIVAAVAVCAPNVESRMRAMADEFVCLAFPEPFGHVGMFFNRLDVPSEAQIREGLEQFPPAEASGV
jgi:putative phosphoribosyl transferase